MDGSCSSFREIALYCKGLFNHNPIYILLHTPLANPERGGQSGFQKQSGTNIVSLSRDIAKSRKNISRTVQSQDDNLPPLVIAGNLCFRLRVSQKIQKSEFWNVTYPSGFHRLDEPPEKISAL